MTMVRFKGIKRWVDERHGGVVVRLYLRASASPTGKDIPLPGPEGSPEFIAAYHAARSGGAVSPVALTVGLNRSKPNTLAGLVASFKASPEYIAAVDSTRASYNSVLESIRAEYGDLDARGCTGEHINKEFAKKIAKHKASYANKWLRMMRRLFEIAINQSIRTDNPADRVNAIKQKRAQVEDGFHSWNEAEITQYKSAYGPGTQARMAMTIMLCTSQRGSDAVVLGRQHLSRKRVMIGGKVQHVRMIKVRQIKTGQWVDIPLHPDLAAEIDLLPAGQMQFLVTEHGKAMAVKTLRNKVAIWCSAISMPDACRGHGLRKAACRRMAEAGCTEKEIASISGHADMRTLALYVKAASDAKLAISATNKLLEMERLEGMALEADQDGQEAAAA